MPDDSRTPAALPGDQDLQEMWSALLDGNWDSLAVIPTDHGISVQRVMDALPVAAGKTDGAVTCVDGRGTEVVEAKRLAQEVATSLGKGSRTVVVVDPLIRSLSGVHLVHGVDAILLVVRVGALDLDSLASTITIVGAERILGSVAAPAEG